MSYRVILSVVNEHTASTVAARYAISLAAAGKARLVLYAAQDEEADPSALRHSQHHLDHLFRLAFDLGIPVTRVTEKGIIPRLLPQRAMAEEADLVFYPLTPAEHYKAALQRQTIHHLLRSIQTNFAVMRIVHMGKPHPRHILVPMGGIVRDKEGRGTFLFALAHGFNSQITLFHRHGDRRAKAMPDDITLLRELLRQHNVTVLERSGSGQISRAITLEAISHHNDLIVLGASERSILRRLFFGDPAGDVMLRPPCNAILFRAARKTP